MVNMILGRLVLEGCGKYLQMQKYSQNSILQLSCTRKRVTNLTFPSLNSKCGPKGIAKCETDACLSDSEVIDGVNRESRSLGWTATNYTEFWGQKLSRGLQRRLGTLEPRFRVKAMTRLSNKEELLPRRFNSNEDRDRLSGLVTDVRDQGWCG